MTETCIHCDRDTGINVGIPVALRAFYIEGQGQLCFKCAQELGFAETPDHQSEKVLKLAVSMSTCTE